MIPEFTPVLRHTQSHVALHVMIDQLKEKHAPIAGHHANTIINHIPGDLHVMADQHQLASIIGSLMDKILRFTSNSDITISARFYHNVMLVHLKGNSRFNTPEFEKELEEVNNVATDIGGTVGVTSYRNEITTVALTFRNARRA